MRSPIRRALGCKISVWKAIEKTAAREFSKIGTTVVEEALTSFTSWLVKEYTKFFAKGG